MEGTVWKDWREASRTQLSPTDAGEETQTSVLQLNGAEFATVWPTKKQILP